MKTSTNQTDNRVGAKEKADLTFNRYDVLALLWKRAKWLDSEIDLKQLKINEALKQRVYMAQVENSILKTMIYGLKDEELELRVAELEQKIKDGIVIEQRTEEDKKFRI